MSLVLIATTPDESASLKRILQAHELVIISTMKTALQEIQGQAFDLIIVSVHFDQSRMFEFIRAIKSNLKNGNKPIICYCVRETKMTQLMHQSLQCTTRLLGAWMYLNEHDYNVYKDPDQELLRVIERCLTAEARKGIQQERIDIQRQRVELHALRMLLQAQEWSPELKMFRQHLMSNLQLLQLKVTKVQLFADGQRLKVETSRDLKDRVSEDVTNDENTMSKREEAQSLEEALQLTHEDELVGKETIQEKEGLLKVSLRDSQEQI